jgi:hypothetical protein
LRKVIASSGALVGVLALLVLVPSAGAATGGGCQLDGTANFATGLGTTAQDFQYSFNGILSNCQSSESGAPASGTVSAGEVVTINGIQYREPVSTGNGSCGSSTTQGTAIVTWADGTNTVVGYTTSGAAAAVALQGTVLSSITLQPVNATDPPLTIASTRYAGQSAAGPLVFEASPPDCNSPTGVTSAGIAGAIALGSAS